MLTTFSFRGSKSKPINQTFSQHSVQTPINTHTDPSSEDVYRGRCIYTDSSYIAGDQSLAVLWVTCRYSYSTSHMSDLIIYVQTSFSYQHITSLAICIKLPQIANSNFK